MTKREMEHRYWGQRADDLDAATSFVIGSITQQRIKNWLQDQIDESFNVLELGCGTGVFSEVIALTARNLIATDLSDEMLEKVEVRLKEYGNVVVKKENSYAITFTNQIFDAVFLGNLIHVVGEPEKVMKEVYRVLKNNGKIISIDSTWFGLSLWPKIRMAFRYLQAFGIPPKTNRNMRPDEIEKIVRDAGFDMANNMLIGKETKAICLSGFKMNE